MKRTVVHYKGGKAGVRPVNKMKPSSPGTGFITCKVALRKNETVVIAGNVKESAASLVKQGCIIFKKAILQFQGTTDTGRSPDKEAGAKIEGKIIRKGTVLNESIGVDTVQAPSIFLIRGNVGSNLISKPEIPFRIPVANILHHLPQQI